MTTYDTGRIIDIKNRRAYIELRKEASCSDCGHCSKGGDNAEMIVQVPLEKGHLADGKEVHTGDAVTMECRTSSPALMGLLYFFLPLSLSIAGYIVSSNLLTSAGVKAVKAVSIAAALFLFVLPYVILFVLRKRNENRGRRWIRIVEVSENGGKTSTNSSCCPGRGIVQEAEDRGTEFKEVKDFEAVKGKGVHGRIDGSGNHSVSGSRSDTHERKYGYRGD